jgi:hypothetical protein
MSNSSVEAAKLDVNNVLAELSALDAESKAATEPAQLREIMGRQKKILHKLAGKRNHLRAMEAVAKMKQQSRPANSGASPAPGTLKPANVVDPSSVGCFGLSCMRGGLNKTRKSKKSRKSRKSKKSRKSRR